MPEFLHPGFLYALPAALIPVVIHLLNRRRYRRVPWGAMAHLLRAERVSRRRIRWQNLLLLALRTAAVALLVLLFARPVVSAVLPRAPGAAARVVMLLDDSGSMAERRGGRSALERARGYALAAAESAAGRGGAFAVYAASLAEPVFQADPFRRDDLARLREALAALGPTAGSLEPGRRLAELAAAAGGGAVDVRFYLLTDLRAADWGAGELEAGARRGLEALQERGPVVVVDVGAEPAGNLGLTQVVGLDRPVYARERARLGLLVRNDGASASGPATAAVRLHGPASGPLPPVAVPAVPPGESRTVPFDVALDEPGAYALTAVLRGDDAFPADDRRGAAFTVLGELPVLVVEGRVGAGYFLRRALQPQAAGRPGLSVRTRAVASGPPGELDRYAGVFLCDVARPGTWAAALADYVRGGGRLVAFAGGRVEPAAWNTAGGLLPGRLRERVEASEGRPFRLTDLDFTHPLLAPFEGWEGLFGAARIGALLRCEPGEDARVLARFTDPAGSPAIVVARRDAGLTALVCTSADEEWSDWPRSEVARVTYLSLAQWLAEQGRPAAASALNVEGIVRLEPPEESPPGLALEPEAPARLPGVYAWRAPGRPEPAAFVAVNLAARERMLARAVPRVVEGARLRAGSLRVIRYDRRVAEAGLGAAWSERRWWAALAALIGLLLAAESALAFLFGRAGGRAR